VLGLLDRCVTKVYAAVRRPEAVEFDDSRVVPLRPDLLGHESVAAASLTAKPELVNKVKPLEGPREDVAAQRRSARAGH